MASSKAASHEDTWSGRYFTSYIYVPYDLIMNILQRLPVKTLLRFKTVSKRWLSLISDPSFVYSHLRHTSENNDSLRHIGSSIVDLPYFEGELSHYLFIVGSCNGIVCIASFDRIHSLPRFNFRRHKLYCCNFRASATLQIHLWNPATKKSNLLPSVNRLPHVDTNLDYIGFGFDPIASDFKVVRFTDSRAMVYSTTTSAWKEIKHPEEVPSHSICDACLNGVLYWTRDDGVIRYDLNNEVFYIHRFPADVQKITYKYQIMEMKDSIVVIRYLKYGEGFRSKVKLWTVDDGFDRYWTPRYSFDVTCAVDQVHGSINSNGEILFKTKNGVWWLHNLECSSISRA
ncbi:putative F-box protein At3g10430 [Apium graveolens]|uniref:putative F-box protein At3g10430 n=1 Tax=Apium graveolens TaxID=4045 RepID=UPI003D7916E3